MRVGDIVALNEIKSWINGDVITIKAGTGMGKSYFIKNHLYEFAKENNKKILFLIHRVNCVNQFQEEIKHFKKTDVIDIRTYQHIEAKHKNNKKFDFSDYHYIVCDEFHYFMSDAAFNKTTDMSLNAILNQLDKIKIFMSATGNHMTAYINNFKKIETINYSLETNFNFIKNLFFFNEDSQLDKVANDAIENNIKTIFFIRSAKKAYKLFQKFKDHALFNCSQSNKVYSHFIDKKKISSMLKEEKFHKPILITTTAMDSGVNIRDEEVSRIICDVEDINVLIQCIGRKRPIHKEDKIDLYIKTITNQQLGGRERQLKKKIEMAKFLKENSVEEYVKRYQRENDHYNIVYDEVTNETDKATKKINHLMYFKCLVDISEIYLMKRFGEFGYCKYLAETFGFFDDRKQRWTYEVMETKEKANELGEYLENLVGKRLFKEEQKELIEKIDWKINGRRQRSYKKLNERLKIINLPYEIITKRNKNARYWTIEEQALKDKNFDERLDSI